MRITGFHVDGFGLLADQAVDGIGAGTTVVLGPNEAGKSTLHAFLVRTLFGHPRANDVEGRNRHEPLRGGRHGGVVHCADERGDWEVHRHTEGSPRLRVVDPDGVEGTGNDAVLPLLGRTVDEARYEQVFAIDLDDLAGVGSLGGGSLDDLLFDAATVGTGRSLRAARDEAIARRDALWTPTSTKRPLAVAITRRSEARSALAGAQDAARGNLDIRRRLDAAAERVEQLSARQEQQAGRIALLERVRDAWPSWSRADELRARLVELSDAPVDDEQLAEARDATVDLEAARTHRAELAEERTAADRDAAAAQLDTDALTAADEVEALAEGLGAHELVVEQLVAATNGQRTARRAVEAALADVGGGWDEDRVREVPVDAPTRQRLEAAGDTLLDAQLRAEAAAERAEEARRTAARRARAAEEAHAALPDAPGESQVVAAEQALRMLRAGVPALEASVDPAGGRVDTTGARAGLGTPARGLALALLVVALVVGVAAAAGTLPDVVPDAVVIALVAAAVGASAYVLGRTGRGRAPSGAVAVTHDEQLARDVAEAADRVGLSGHPSLADVERVAGRIERARRDRRQRGDAERHLTSLQAEADEARVLADEHTDVAAAREQEHDDAAAAWASICAEVGMDAAEDPVRVTLTRYDRVATARRALDDLAAATDRVERTRPRVEQFRADVAAVARQLGHDVEGEDAVRLLPGLRDRVRAARSARVEHDRHIEHRDELDRAIARAEEAAAGAVATRDEALAAAGVDTLAELERRAEIASERADLTAELDGTERAVTQLLGSGPRGEQGRELLRTADPTAWEQELAAAEEAAATLTEERDRALAERTELEAQLRRLGGDDAVPRAAQELAAAELEVAELAERWAVADTAARLLEETVARFEREQQPRVLTRASDLLERATGGQWAQVRRLDGQVVVARSEGGDPVPAEVLSRGTREQLWLCLRLALAEDLSQDRPLPLLVDDLLGTSDPDRSQHVVRVLAEVARRQQVWVFTCHPRTAELVTSTDPSTGVLRLHRGGRIAGLSRRDLVPPDDEFVLQLDV